MKIICAPDSFKESLSGKHAAEAIARGVARALPNAEIDICPISDGGEGFTDTLLTAMPGTASPMSSSVPGPLSTPVMAAWGMVDSEQGGRTAIIEMAAASGLELVPSDQRDPRKMSTYGTGALIRFAIDKQPRRILLGIGGSATNDGGCGMAQMLGTTFLDGNGEKIDAPITGGMLATIARILPSSLQFDIELSVACDVTNPLTGPNGAAYTYGPQKGASPEQVQQLDEGLQHLARIVREQLGVDHENTPGAGAAGGLGFGLITFLGAELKSGIDLVLDAVRFDERVRDADLVLTGEGKLDGQSLSGKACLGVAQRAKRVGVPTIALVGSVGESMDQVIEAGLDSYAVIGAGLSLAESMKRTAELLESMAASVCKSWKK